jgi:hypothetical protein
MTVRAPAPLGLVPSFGFGDRLGLATLGHLDAWRASGGPIQPVFAQQSMRELSRSGRKPTDVMRDTLAALTTGSFTGAWGADADRLKTPGDINAAASAGFPHFTLDVSAFVDLSATTLSPHEVDLHFQSQRDDLHWGDDYRGTLELAAGISLEFERTEVRRAALKFGPAISQAVKLSAHADRIMGKRREAYEIEVTCDEAAVVPSLLEHYILADQCLKANVRLIGVGLRWSQELQPAVDFLGDVSQFAANVAAHCAVARALGGYKLCLHHGSDKFQLYEAFARASGGLFHVKTAGTSYLEGLRVAARHERRLFRRIVDFARQRFEQDRATYDVTARLDEVPQAAAVPDDLRLEQLYLSTTAGRQILHVTYGSILADKVLGPSLRDVLVAHPETHREVVARHLGRHLEFLNRGLNGSGRNSLPRKLGV